MLSGSFSQVQHSLDVAAHLRKTMDTEGEAVNLGEEEIIKNTQVSPEDYSGSPIPSTTEPRIMSRSSQPGHYVHSPYVSYGTMRGSDVHPFQNERYPLMSQIPYVQHNAWPTYGPGFGGGVHPIPQFLPSGMYSPFPSGNFSGISTPYASSSHGGPTDSFLFSQPGVVGVVNSNADSQRVTNKDAPVQDLFGSPAILRDPHPLSGRTTVSNGGPWFCPRPRERDFDEGRQNNAVELSVSCAQPVAVDESRLDRMNNIGFTHTSEMHSSPPPDSTETQQGPRRSSSTEVGRSAGRLNDQRGQTEATTQSQFDSGMQRPSENTSKLTLNPMNIRKAFREDGKRYLKEVKMAISEGRVPQVTILQDESGNILRYKSQFMNALKLAAHAVVQDAYIDVNEQEIMNEIMEEVRRQFIWHTPLPVGMVEGFLKRYFKRCRLEYHKFWIKHRDKKRPDGCKQAAWLKLVESWKSAEETKECRQEKRNASSEKVAVKEGKSVVRSFKSGDDLQGCETTASPTMNAVLEELSDFACATPATSKAKGASLTVMRNPMADISNQLHDAVDNILSSFAGSCHSLPSSNVKVGNTGLQRPPIAKEFPKTVRGGTRTAEEVLGSLQRPQITVNRVLSTNFTKESVIDSSGRVQFTVKEGIDNDLGAEKAEELILLSDASSEGERFSPLKSSKGKSVEDVKFKNEVYTEEMESWPCKATESGSAIRRNGKQSTFEGEKLQCTLKAKMHTLSQGEERIFVDDEDENEEDDIEDRLNTELDGDSDEEEAPVLPRKILKRKLDAEYGGSSGNNDKKAKAGKKVSKAHLKRQKVTEIDSSVLKKLVFYKRPKNANPIKTRTRVWILHPKYEGKVVAEGHAWINRRSRCVDSANEICKEGQQMVNVTRVLYKNLPVMYDVHNRFPKNIGYLNMAEGLPNMPILWCISHLIEIPPLSQITRLLHEFIEPLSQETANGASDLEEICTRRQANSTPSKGKEMRRVRVTNAGSIGVQGSKLCRTPLRPGS